MITPAGQDHKFRITCMIPNFDMERDDFSFAIRDYFSREFYSFEKEDCFQDSEGRYYFLMENVPTGEYFAYFTAKVPDDDYDKQVRIVKDNRPLCKVGMCNCHSTSSCQCGELVKYEEVWTTNVDGGVYLADRDGNFILTSDGKRISFKK